MPSYEYEDFEVRNELSDADPHLFTVEIIMIMTDPGGPPFYGSLTAPPDSGDPPEFDIECIQLINELTDVPISSRIKRFNEVEFAWMFPKGQHIIDLAYEWAQENTEEFVL